MIDYKTLISLIDIFEYSQDKIVCLDGSTVRGIPIWTLDDHLENRQALENTRFFKKVGYARSYPSLGYGQCDLRECKDDDNTLWFANESTYEPQVIACSEATVYQVQEDSFIAQIQALFQTTSDGTRLNKYLWKIGLSQRLAGVYFYLARGLMGGVSSILKTLDDCAGPAIVLAAGNTLPPDIKWPHGCVVKRLRDVVMNKEDRPQGNVKWLKLLLENDSVDKPSDDPNIRYDEEKHILHIKGKPGWHIRGARHRAAVQYMLDQRAKRRSPLKAKEILDNTKSLHQVGGSKSIQSVLKGTPWKEYIYSPKTGYYAFTCD